MVTFRQRTAIHAVEAPLDATVIYGRQGARTTGPLQPPRLVVVRGPRAGALVALGGDELTVGRGWDNDLVLPDISVSRRHALLRRDGVGYLLVDQGSGNGTRLNGRMVDKARLRNGDEIALGDSVVQFVEAGAPVVRGNAAPGRAPILAGWLPGPLRSRSAACAGMAALLLGATALALRRGQEREQAARDDAFEQRDQVRAVARQNVARGASLLDEHRWSDAGELKHAAELDPQPPHAVREAQPAKPDAPEPKAPLDGPRRRVSRAQRAGRAPPASSRIAEAYLGGDLAAALEQARAARADPAATAMLARLERFAAASREGAARREEGHPAEAIAAFEQADAADRALAAGRDSPLGREVRRGLSSLHTRMAADHASDEEAATAAAHLRAALAHDPGNEEARERLARFAARAEEAWLSGYVAKDSDPDAARRAFRLVVAALAPTDETAIKARRWLDRLGGKPGREEEPAP